MRHLFVLSLLSLASPSRAEDWPAFRGPDGQGHSAAKGIPLTWSETENIKWKVPIAGLGWSSPTIVKGQIWLTTGLDDGKSLRAVCLSPKTGKILHDVEVFAKTDPGTVHQNNSHASPTAIVEGDRVYVHYGAHGTACVSTKGKVLWRNNELVYDHRHGPGGSPALFEDLLIIICDGDDVQFVAALDKMTGEVRWKKRRVGRMAYCTPLIIHSNGVDQAICPGGEHVTSYDPRTGEELWYLRHGGYSVVPRPVFDGERVFFSTSYNNPVFYAVRVDGSKDVTETHVAWSLSKDAPHNASPLLIGEELYLVSDRGIATCLNAATGEQHWQERLDGAYWASPLAADGRIYYLNQEGLTTVLAQGREFKKLATNQVEGRTLASLAAVGKTIYLRTDTHLYRIEE